MDSDSNDLKLQLGPEFQNAICLFNSEVGVILNNRKEKSNENEVFNPVFQQTLSYVQRFDIYKNQSSVREIRKMLTNKGLDQYQVAAIANLCPPSAEEAKALIPDLNMNDADLQIILNDLSNFRSL